MTKKIHKHPSHTGPIKNMSLRQPTADSSVSFTLVIVVAEVVTYGNPFQR